MSLPSIIKNCFLVFSFAFCVICSAQEEEKEIDTEPAKSSIFSSKERQKLFAFSAGIHNPIATGDNFIGSALAGKSGYDFRLKLFIYKQFFLEYSNTSSRFRVENNQLVGNYRNTRISGEFLNVGYELLPLPDFRLGLNVAFFGNSSISNSGFTNSNGENQRDTGNLSSYGCYIAYDIHSYASIYIDYSYRRTKTNITSPPGLENFFNEGTFHTIGIGLMLTVGKKDAVSSVLDYEF